MEQTTEEAIRIEIASPQKTRCAIGAIGEGAGSFTRKKTSCHRTTQFNNLKKIHQ